MFSKPRFFAFVMICTFCSSPSLAKTKKKGESTTEVPSSDTPTFRVGEGISDQIYKQSMATVSSSYNSSLRVESSLRMFFPASFELTNKYFTVPYSENVDNLKGFTIGPEAYWGDVGGGRVSTFGHIGYAYTQGIYEVKSESGLTVTDAVELQWIPIQAGMAIASPPYTRQRITFGASSSAGIDWYTQSGQLDGMNQSFWVPRYEVGGNVVLFSSERPGEGGFDGVKLSSLFYRSFLSEQSNRGWAADVGARYAF